MALYKEIVYMCLDAIKSSNGDSSITEEHVIFLANQYRIFVIEQKRLKQGDSSLSSANEQTICLDLETVNAIPNLEHCNDIYLKSVQEVPDVVSEEPIKVNLSDMFNIMTAFVSKERFKYVGHNKYLKNIIYFTLGSDNHVYLNSANPQFKYLKKATLTGVFEDAEKAAELACNKEDGSKCDILDQTFPLETNLIPQLIELVVKELLGANWRQKDGINNAADDLADLVAYIKRNTKSDLQKQISG